MAEPAFSIECSTIRMKMRGQKAPERLIAQTQVTVLLRMRGNVLDSLRRKPLPAVGTGHFLDEARVLHCGAGGRDSGWTRAAKPRRSAWWLAEPRPTARQRHVPPSKVWTGGITRNPRT